ncbi:replication-relaxation family protein [Streptomyces griseoincarnatus]
MSTASTVAAENIERAAVTLQPAAGETSRHRALALLAQHRLVTTPQMHQMLSPGGARSKTSTTMNQLRRDELATFTFAPGSARLKAWFLTARGGSPRGGRSCADTRLRPRRAGSTPRCEQRTP